MSDARRVTINLSGRYGLDFDRVRELTGENQTDGIGRSLRLRRLLLDHVDAGGRIALINRDGNTQEVMFL